MCATLSSPSSMLKDHTNATKIAFSRIIDSFTGVLFMITDRIAAVSETILSRIHLTLRYPSLDEISTARVFELNLKWVRKVFLHRYSESTSKLRIEEAEILDFARRFWRQRPRDRWNAMQIRNAFRTALSLAEKDSGGRRTVAAEVILNSKHFEVVANAHSEFSDYMSAVFSSDAASIERRPRRDDFIALPARGVSQQPESLSVTHQQYPQRSVPVQQQALSYETGAEIVPQLDHGEAQRTYHVPNPILHRVENYPVVPNPGSLALSAPLSLEARPELERMNWQKFKESRAKRGRECCVIDVLIGVPDITFDDDAFESLWQSRWIKLPRKGAESSESRIGRTSDSSTSKAIPERIRIHSKHIVQELERLRGQPLHTSSVVMIRPFRTLMYYEQEIRNNVKQLAMSSSDGTVDSLIPDHGRNPVLEQNLDGDYEQVDGSDMDGAASSGYEDLKCVIGFIDNEIQPRRQYLLSNNCKKVSFADVWFLFSPGVEVLSQDRKQVYRVIGVTSSRHRVVPPWQSLTSPQHGSTAEKLAKEAHVTLHCVHVDFDGRTLGPVLSAIHLFRFDGDIPVTALPVYPLRLAEDPMSTHLTGNKSFRDRLIARGKTFLELVGTKAMHYHGLTLDTRDEVDSQVVIDFEQAFTSSEETCEAPKVEKFIEKVATDFQDDHVCSAACCAGEEIHEDDYVEKKMSEDYISSLVTNSEEPIGKELSVAVYARSLSDKSWEKDKLDDRDFLIMSHRVFGFVLRNRKWANLDMDHITPIGSQMGEKGSSMDLPVFKTPLGGIKSGGDGMHAEEVRTAEQVTTFDQLVLPRNHKEIVLSLVAQHFQDKSSGNTELEETDIVKGKGKGLIILLHGAPGVGKTTTAEGIAQVFNRPLFPITCGDLGTDAASVEAALERHFALANRWGCVLLLDEADVFLAERSPQDFVRNSLVAVFLRVLEYYAGILFLTTNRIGDFDEAFSSRIHVSLYYPPLKLKPTLRIFKLNLGIIQQRIEGRGVSIDIREPDILHFAERYWRKNKKMRWNGRQIRNACQTALALAEYEAQRGVVQDRRTLDAKSEAKREVNVGAKVELTQRHLEKVADAYLEFMKYLKDIYGRDPERRAKAMGWRAREVFKTGKGPAGKEGVYLHFSEQEDPEDEEESEDDEVSHGLDKVTVQTEAHSRANPSANNTKSVSDNTTKTQIPVQQPPSLPQQQDPRETILTAQNGAFGMPMGGGNVMFPNMLYTPQMPMAQMWPQMQGQSQQQFQQPSQQWGAPTITDAQRLAAFQQQQAAMMAAQGPAATGGVPLEQQPPRKPT